MYISLLHSESNPQLYLCLKEFFPPSHQAHTWAVETTETLAAWGATMQWGEEDYTDSDTQLFIMRQFEQVVETPHVTESDTKFLWLANFNVWMSRHCTANFDREHPDVLECGRDQLFPNDNTTCAGFWAPNKYHAREKVFGDGEQCIVYEGGVCRPTSQMHPLDLAELVVDPANPGDEANSSWCPVFNNFSDSKLQFCLMRWHNFTGGGGGLIKKSDTATPNPTCAGEYFNDAVIETPLLFSTSPNLVTFDLATTEDYLDMIRETRAVCDDVDRGTCRSTEVVQYTSSRFFLTLAFLFCSPLLDVGYPIQLLGTVLVDRECAHRGIGSCNWGWLLCCIHLSVWNTKA
jgi:hypothetical protein